MEKRFIITRTATIFRQLIIVGEPIVHNPTQRRKEFYSFARGWTTPDKVEVFDDEELPLSTLSKMEREQTHLYQIETIYV